MERSFCLSIHPSIKLSICDLCWLYSSDEQFVGFYLYSTSSSLDSWSGLRALNILAHNILIIFLIIIINVVIIIIALYKQQCVAFGTIYIWEFRLFWELLLPKWSICVCVYVKMCVTTGAGSGLLLYDRWTCHLVLPMYMFPSLPLSTLSLVLSPSVSHRHTRTHTLLSHFLRSVVYFKCTFV